MPLDPQQQADYEQYQKSVLGFIPCVKEIMAFVFSRVDEMQFGQVKQDEYSGIAKGCIEIMLKHDVYCVDVTNIMALFTQPFKLIDAEVGRIDALNKQLAVDFKMGKGEADLKMSDLDAILKGHILEVASKE